MCPLKIAHKTFMLLLSFACQDQETELNSVSNGQNQYLVGRKKAALLVQGRDESSKCGILFVKSHKTPDNFDLQISHKL